MLFNDCNRSVSHCGTNGVLEFHSTAFHFSGTLSAAIYFIYFKQSICDDSYVGLVLLSAKAVV